MGSDTLGAAVLAMDACGWVGVRPGWLIISGRYVCDRELVYRLEAGA